MIDDMTNSEVRAELKYLKDRYRKCLDAYIRELVEHGETLKRNEELEIALLTIGDMAVIDWDGPTVGEVDKVTSEKYMDKYIAFRREYEDLKEENKRLKLLV